MKSLYKRQFLITAGMILISFALLSVVKRDRRKAAQ